MLPETLPLETIVLVPSPLREEAQQAQIKVNPPLAFPDGMRALGGDALSAVEATGALVKIDLTGGEATSTVLSNRFDGPTSVVQAGQSY